MGREGGGEGEEGNALGTPQADEGSVGLGLAIPGALSCPTGRGKAHGAPRGCRHARAGGVIHHSR